MSRRKVQRRVRTALLLTVGVSMLAISGSLLTKHAQAVLEVQEISVPLVADIPNFERRLAMLTDQIELAELNAATSLGSEEEYINVFVIPESIDFDRLLAVFDVVGSELKSQGLLSEISEITMGDPISSEEEGLETRKLSIKFSAHENGVQAFLSLVKFAGLLSVGDMLSEDERRILLQKTEEENPAGVVAMEQFLSTDILSYTGDPKTHETQLLRSFTSPLFVKSFQDTLQSSLMRDARRILGGQIGTRLSQHDLWPLPLMMLDEVRIHPGGAPRWFTLSVAVKVYSRTNAL